MLLKLQKIHLSEAPAKICTTVEELSTAMEGLVGKKICTFIGHSNGQTLFIYAEVLGNDQIEMNNLIALVAPCPPYCTKEGGNDLYAWV
jgi:hypothetical protein